MEIEAVLFDIDGTLVDSNEQHVNAWSFAFREEGHPQEPDDIRAQIGKGGDLLEVKPIISAATSIDDVEASKPEPDIFGVALEKIGVAPSTALVVGDTIYDVDAALRAGIMTVGVTSGPFDERQLKDAGAIAVFADVASILREFDRSPLAR